MEGNLRGNQDLMLSGALLPFSTVYDVLTARILEWFAIPSSIALFLIVKMILNAILGCLKCLFRLFHMLLWNILTF